MSNPAVILVVEDNFANQLLTVALLEREGYEVDLANTSAEAIEQLQTRRPDLILMDIQLPGQDGLVVTRRLKADPATAAIPIVALTANAMTGDCEQALAAGCTGYLSKPIDTRMFGVQISAFLRDASSKSNPNQGGEIG